MRAGEVCADSRPHRPARRSSSASTSTPQASRRLDPFVPIRGCPDHAARPLDHGRRLWITPTGAPHTPPTCEGVPQREYREAGEPNTTGSLASRVFAPTSSFAVSAGPSVQCTSRRPRTPNGSETVRSWELDFDGAPSGAVRPGTRTSRPVRSRTMTSGLATEELIETACEQAGLDDFGAGTFRLGLDRLASPTRGP
jgi:hypothetical protein